MAKFSKNQLVTVKSGKVYRILASRGALLDNEPCYRAVMLRDGKPFGPQRIVKEANLTAKEA